MIGYIVLDSRWKHVEAGARLSGKWASSVHATLLDSLRGEDVDPGYVYLRVETGRMGLHVRERIPHDVVAAQCNGIAYVQGCSYMYENGLRHGATMSWWSNGARQMECRYNRGKLQGRMQMWDRWGQRTADGHYSRGNMVGRWREWDRHGVQTLSMRYRLGRLHGTMLKHNANGVTTHEKFRDGVPLERRDYAANGQLTVHVQYRGGTIRTVHMWRPDGSLQLEETVSDERSERRVYWPSGQLSEWSVSSVLLDHRITWRSTGQIRTYDIRDVHGGINNMIRWDADGALTRVQTRQYDQWWSRGELVQLAEMRGGHGQSHGRYWRWHAGQLVECGRRRHGRRHGPVHYYKWGMHVKTVRYSSGREVDTHHVPWWLRIRSWFE